MAGLAAAHELIQAGHEVVVLEARTRPGGRIETLRAPFAEGLQAEGSAARIPESHELVLEYVRRLGLDLEPFQPEATDLFYLNGQVLRSDQPDLLQRAGLTPEEQRLGPDGIAERRMGRFLAELGDLTADGWPGEELLRYDRVSGTELLRGAGVSDAAIRFFDAGFGLFDEISGLELLMQAPSAFGDKYRIVGGTDRLPDALAREISTHIRYGAPVVRIEQDADSVVAVCDGANGRDRVTADRLICTIPFPVLREMEIVPAVSEAKRNVIDNLHYESVTRVYVQVRERFWERKGLSGFALTDQPMEIWDASHGQPGTRGILMAYMRGQKARDVAALPAGRRVSQTLAEIGQVFPEVGDYYDGAVSLVWDEDPWTRGAYTAYHPGEMNRVYHDLAPPEGRIHFAGEHASPWPGWILGAVHSGLRAARQVNAVRG